MDTMSAHTPNKYVQIWSLKQGYTLTGERVTVSVPLGHVTVTGVPRLAELCVAAVESLGGVFNGIYDVSAPVDEGHRDITVYMTKPTGGVDIPSTAPQGN